NKFLAQGVEAAVVVVDGVHRISGVPLIDSHGGDQVAVWASVVAPGRQIFDSQKVEAGKPASRDKEDDGAPFGIHVFFFSSRRRPRCFMFACASITISGSATAPTVICDSATSGA